jgi:hypothetical protein
VRVFAGRNFPTITWELYYSLWNRGRAEIAIRFSSNAGNRYHIAVVDVLIFGTSGETIHTTNPTIEREAIKAVICWKKPGSCANLITFLFLTDFHFKMAENVVYHQAQLAVEQTLGSTIYPGTEIMTDGMVPLQNRIRSCH